MNPAGNARPSLFITLESGCREHLTLICGNISPGRSLSPGFPYLYMSVPGVSYTMHAQSQPVVALARGTFSLDIAPSPVLIPALSRSLALLQGSVLFLSGPAPAVIPRLSTSRSEKRRISLTRTPQILTALEDATEQIIIIEHDRALYDDHAYLIRPVALLCRTIAADRRAVLICATRPDGWLNTFESYAHRMVLVGHVPPEGPNQDLPVPGSGGQMTLQGVV